MSTRRRRALNAREGQQRPSARAAEAPPEALEHLLDDVRDLRLTLVADLSAAAAAVEADSARVAAEIVESDRRDLMAFLQRSGTRLDALARTPQAADPVVAPTQRTWRRRLVISLPAVPLVGALAMSAAAAAGLLPLPTHSSPKHVHVLNEGSAAMPPTFTNFETVLAGDPSASQVVAAASALHEQIAAMIANAPQNPGGVGEVARLLQLEQALLLRTQPPGSKLVLAQSRKLAAQLLNVASHPSSTQPTPASVPTSPASSPHKSPSTKASSTSSPSPKSSTKPSTSPSSKPSSSPSSTDAPGHIPTIGG